MQKKTKDSRKAAKLKLKKEAISRLSLTETQLEAVKGGRPTGSSPTTPCDDDGC